MTRLHQIICLVMAAPQAVLVVRAVLAAPVALAWAAWVVRAVALAAPRARVVQAVRAAPAVTRWGGQGGGAGGTGGAGGGSSVPQSGEVIITEIMFDPHNGLRDQFAEFIEIHNPGDNPFSLEDCVLSDGTADAPAGEVTIAPGGYVVYARSADTAENGNLSVAGVFEFSLNNSRDLIALTCGGRLVDQVRYDFDEGFPRARGFSMSLSPGQEAADSNDRAANWCFARRVYLEDPIQWGTPGAANSTM